MTLTKNPVSRNRRFSPRNLFETCMALLVLCNYILVIFDLTYILLDEISLAKTQDKGIRKFELLTKTKFLYQGNKERCQKC